MPTMLQTYFGESGNPKIGCGGLEGSPQAYSIHIFWKILAILGHFLTHNVLFQVEGALKHLFAGSKNFQYMVVCVRHLQKRMGGACTDHRRPKNNVSLPTIVIFMHFYVILRQKWAFFGWCVPESPFF